MHTTSDTMVRWARRKRLRGYHSNIYRFRMWYIDCKREVEDRRFQKCQ